MNLSEIKNKLKTEAKQLSELKAEIKQLMKSGSYAGSEQWNLISFKRHWRHRHIAYCLMKGTAIEKIENHVREDNEPNQKLIDKYREEFTND